MFRPFVCCPVMASCLRRNIVEYVMLYTSAVNVKRDHSIYLETAEA